MFGSPSMGDLVIATGDNRPDNEVFRESGNLGNQWNQGFVDFTGAQNMKVSIFFYFFFHYRI
jgi:trehalose-6-phosphatase